MDNLTDLPRADLEELCRGLRRLTIRLKAEARRDTERIEWAETQARVYRRLVEKLLREAEDGTRNPGV